MRPLAVLASGMVTGVGLTSAATCAAIRAAVDAFDETRFIDEGGEWIIGSAVPLEKPWRGIEKLVRMAASAIGECFEAAGDFAPDAIPVLLAVAEPDRPGRLADVDQRLLPEIEQLMGLSLHPDSTTLPRGKVAIAEALEQARELIFDRSILRCIVAGVDSFLVAGTLSAYERSHRLLTSTNSNGFIPGEGAAAVLLGPGDDNGEDDLQITGIGYGTEDATIESEEPLRADGLVEAIRSLTADCGHTLDAADYRITDLSGEQYGFKEATLAVSRVLRKLKPEFDIWHPADCIGEVGAAIGPCTLGVALAAARKEYAPGAGVFLHFGNDDGKRAALLALGSADGV